LQNKLTASQEMTPSSENVPMYANGSMELVYCAILIVALAGLRSPEGNICCINLFSGFSVSVGQKN
jgi:hypothetical protein